MARPFHFALVGFGNIGTGVVAHWRQHRALLESRVGRPFVLKAICDIDLKTDRGVSTEGITLTSNMDEVIGDPTIDCVIELIGGTRIARTLVEKALGARKHVVTANKALIAETGRELFDLAERHGVALLYEASVGAGIPLIKSLNGALLPNAVSMVRGIVNGTTNFILSQMAATPGLGYEEVLKEAMRLGYAEPDPTLDVNGGDAAHKIAILGAMAFGGDRRASDVVREGITAVDSEDFDFARERRHTIKLIAGAYLTAAGVELSVWPTFVSVDHPLGATHGVLNCIEVVGEPMGSMTAIGAGAGKGSTSSGVLSDVMQVALFDNAEMLLRAQPLRPNAPRPSIPPKAPVAHPRRYLRVRGGDTVRVEEALGFEALARRANSIALVAPAQTDAERQEMLANLARLGVTSGDVCEIRTAPPTGDTALLP